MISTMYHHSHIYFYLYDKINMFQLCVSNVNAHCIVVWEGTITAGSPHEVGNMMSIQDYGTVSSYLPRCRFNLSQLSA